MLLPYAVTYLLNSVTYTTAGSLYSPSWCLTCRLTSRSVTPQGRYRTFLTSADGKDDAIVHLWNRSLLRLHNVSESVQYRFLAFLAVLRLLMVLERDLVVHSDRRYTRARGGNFSESDWEHDIYHIRFWISLSTHLPPAQAKKSWKGSEWLVTRSCICMYSIKLTFNLEWIHQCQTRQFSKTAVPARSGCLVNTGNNE